MYKYKCEIAHSMLQTITTKFLYRKHKNMGTSINRAFFFAGRGYGPDWRDLCGFAAWFGPISPIWGRFWARVLSFGHTYPMAALRL
jgi:hypothetical protein